MSDNVNVSAEQIIAEVANMRKAASAQKAGADNLKADIAAAKAINDAMIAKDGQEFARWHGGEDKDTGKKWDHIKYWELKVSGGSLEDLDSAYKAFDNAYQQYATDYKNFMNVLDDAEKSAEVIKDQLNQATEAMGENPTPTPTDEKPEPTPTETDPAYPPGPGGNPGGGDPGGGQSPSSPSYTPPATKEEEDEKDDTDYGDGDEGSETEPTGSQPITTITPITTTTPAATQQTTTTNGTIQTPAASTEQHVGGGYSGSGGFSYDSTQTDTGEEQLEQQAASSIDNIINGRAAPKIPTSSAPIAKAQAARTTGSSVIPAASGLAAAAVIGLGAKAFLDKKKETEEEEEEEMFS